MIAVEQRDYPNIHVECLNCHLESDDNVVTEDGDIRAGTFEGNDCPNCHSYELEVN